MRYGSDHKQQSRERILQAAARSLRARGVDGVSVGQVMAAAGLTHGAFYAHFASRDALIAEAFDATLREVPGGRARLDEANDGTASDGPARARAGLRAFLAGYLSAAHRDRPAQGCPLAALAGDMGRTTDQLRSRFASGVEEMTDRISDLLARLGRSDPDREARCLVAQLVGAVALARGVGKGAQSDAILRDTLCSLEVRYGL